MKKSLLVAPVLGILLVAAAGSVGGTVAWFSASSQWETNISSFKVARLDGNLDCTMVARVGTTLTPATNTISIDPANYVLTHGSLDIASETNPIYVVNNTSENPYRYNSKGNEGAAKSALDGGTLFSSGTSWGALAAPVDPAGPAILYAASWQMKFTYEWGGSYSIQNLYFDVTSTANKTNADAAVGGKETYKGFRIAFLCGNNKFIWAPNQIQSKCHYIGGEHVSYTDNEGTIVVDKATNKAGLSNGTNVGDLAIADDGKIYTWEVVEEVGQWDEGVAATAGDVVTLSGGSVSYKYTGSAWVEYNPVQNFVVDNLVDEKLLVSSADDASRRGDAEGKAILYGGTNFNDTDLARKHSNYIGELTGSAQHKSEELIVTCVAYFEGTDENVINASSMDTIAANLKFFTKARV